MTRIPEPDTGHRTRSNRRAWDINDPTPAGDTVPAFVEATVKAWQHDYNAFITRTPTLEPNADTAQDTP